jgi:hypothetical protein
MLEAANRVAKDLGLKVNELQATLGIRSNSFKKTWGPLSRVILLLMVLTK